MDVVIVGGGISGLAVAYEIQTAASHHGIDANIRVVEAEPRVGGKVDTRRESGFVIEGGVNGWLASKTVVDDLVERVGLGDARLPANPSAKRRYLWRGLGLAALPTNPVAFARSPLLGARGKARLFFEPFARGAPGHEETVAEFFTRRLGPRALDELVDPMVSGIFAGDPAALSIQSAFPTLARLDRSHGGLLRGFVAELRDRRRQRPRAQKKKRAGTTLLSFEQGASQLTDHLASLLNQPPLVSQTVAGVEKSNGGFQIRLGSGEHLDAEQVVLATPAYASGSILADLDSTLARELSGIPYAPIAVAALGWRREDVPHPLDGYGFLVPGREGRDILGALWDSTVFSGRAPEGYVLIRVMLGGARRPELLDRTDDELLAMSTEALRVTTGVSKKPELARVIRHRRGIPQYVVGHADRLARLRARVASHRGLHLTGNAFAGISLADCVAQAPDVAKRVLLASGRVP